MLSLLGPGGFVPTPSLPPNREGVEMRCVFCGRGVELGWLHFAHQRFVCRRCLPNPWLHEGDAGRHMAEQLAALLEAKTAAERAQVEDDLSIW